MKLQITPVKTYTDYYHVRYKLNEVLAVNNCFTGDTKLSEIVEYFERQKEIHENANGH